MIPIPEYLSYISIFGYSKKDYVNFSIKCPCGCNTFFIYENELTKEEKKEVKPFYDAMLYLHGNDGYGCSITVDENGTRHFWKILSPDKSKKEEVYLPPKPLYAGIVVIKAKCESCGREHILFDNRFHGYDGMTSDKTADVLAHKLFFKQKSKQSFSVTIKVENAPSLEDFNYQSETYFDEKQYSNAFSWIVIYRTNNFGVKKKLFDYETA